MFTLHLNVGLASQYLITDIKKGIGVSEKPYVVFSNNLLSDKELAEVLTVIYNTDLSSGFLGMGAKKLDSAQFALFLDDLRNKRKPSMPIVNFKNPVFILSNGFDKRALVAVKVLKIRALCQILAVDMSASGGDTILKIDSELMNNKIEETVFHKIYKSDNKLCMVSGINKTVLSTESNIGQILKKFPDLTSNIDLESVNEPLFE